MGGGGRGTAQPVSIDFTTGPLMLESALEVHVYKLLFRIGKSLFTL